MLDEEIRQNFIDLFSETSQRQIEALLSKKEWILGTFFVSYRFSQPNSEDSYSDIVCLSKCGLPFKKLSYKSIETSESVRIIDKFNENYRYLKLYSSLPQRKNKFNFFAEVDFRKLDKEDYKKLFASFFYCIPSGYLSSSFPEGDIRTIFSRAIEGEKNERVLIIKKDLLDKNMLKTDAFTKIDAYSDLNEEEEAILRKIATSLNIRVVQIHV